MSKDLQRVLEISGETLTYLREANVARTSKLVDDVIEKEDLDIHAQAFAFGLTIVADALQSLERVSRGPKNE